MCCGLLDVVAGVYGREEVMENVVPLALVEGLCRCGVFDVSLGGLHGAFQGLRVVELCRKLHNLRAYKDVGPADGAS